MLDMGMLIDISHCTIKARKRIYDIVESHKKSECLLASHVGSLKSTLFLIIYRIGSLNGLQITDVLLELYL